MSRVKMWMGILAVMIMALAVGTSGAVASTIDFDGSHTFFMTVVQDSTSTLLIPGSGTITTAFGDYADYNPSEGTTGSVGPTAIVVGTASSVATNQAAGTWLIDRNTTTSYNGSTTAAGGTISRNFTGLGPDPDVNANGDIGQINSRTSGAARTQLLQLVYTIPAAGTYTIGFSDTYSSTAAVNQGTGSSFPVSFFDGGAEIHVKIAGPGIGSDNFLTLYSKSYGATASSTPIASFFDSVVGDTITLGPFNPTLTAGTLTCDVYLDAYYDAETTPIVPVPSTVLLLGSGLVGLGLLRRKWSLRK